MCNYISGRRFTDNYVLVGKYQKDEIRDDIASCAHGNRLGIYNDGAYDAHEE